MLNIKPPFLNNDRQLSDDYYSTTLQQHILDRLHELGASRNYSFQKNKARRTRLLRYTNDKIFVNSSHSVYKFYNRLIVRVCKLCSEEDNPFIDVTHYYVNTFSKRLHDIKLRSEIY